VSAIHKKDGGGVPEIMISVDDIEFVKELYPRLREDDAAIERYRASIDLLPPIAVARGRVLVDGFHRWQAHKREGRPAIAAVDLGNLSDAEMFNESIERNAKHGQQLSAKDKQACAAKLWATMAHLPPAERKAKIIATLAVSGDAVERWTKDARSDEKKAAQAKAWDLWLDCKTEQEVADAIGVDQATAHRWINANAADAVFALPPASRQHFDVWSFGKADDDAGTGSYFGKLPGQIAENLLWLYTEPGQVVVDPFAGGGTMIDVAKRMGRRVWASDRKPSTPTLPIHQHDIVTGWPKDAPTKADFIFLDPPYWVQAAGRYSDDPECLGNMSLDDFYAAWEKVVLACKPHLAKGGKLAFIVSPAEQKDAGVEDLALGMFRICDKAGLKPIRRIIATYNTQQATGQQVEWARGNKKLLKLYRDVVVFA